MATTRSRLAALALAMLAAAAASAQMRVQRDIAYGPHAKQRLDLYAPEQARDAMVVFMVHGGAWRFGDKAMGRVAERKAAHWVGAGMLFVSTNYRLLPEADPLQQARDVARALAAAQAEVARFGGDARRFVLMGHSAGAHLVALLTASPEIAAREGALPWLGTVALDSAALDVERTMLGRHLRLHDEAFGADPAFWRAASPYHLLQPGAAPMLLVCSSRRADACPQAHRLAAKATGMGQRASVLEQPLSHAEINERLGEPGTYTEAVDAFLKSL